jgi:FMN phosphatase YigB (HAD superfamily)
LTGFLTNLVVALLVVIIWEGLRARELLLRWLAKFHSKRTWKRLLALTGDVFIAKSTILHEGDKETFRRSDTETEQMIFPHLNVPKPLNSDPGLTAERAAAHFVIIGSTKHTDRARDLQQWYQSEYEYVVDYFHADPPRPILKIASMHGQEFLSSVDIRGKRGSGAIDYGLLFLAAVPERKRVFWLSGIHGAGTIGVADYLLTHADQFLTDQPAGAPWAKQWLFRIQYNDRLPDTREMLEHVELIDGPYISSARKLSTPIRAVICDFGNVLMAFDRDRTYRALAHVCKRPFEAVAADFKSSTARIDYENGSIDDAAFFRRVSELLGPDISIDFETFAEWWGDIFWENRNVVEMFKAIRSQVALIMLSNTNNLHMTSVREHYPDVLNLFTGHVLSYQEKMMKPAPELFHRAMRLAGADVRPEECVYIDDMPLYVDAARKLGMVGFIYYNYPDLVRNLRSVGIQIT